jgi:hypothetical protein
MFCGSGRGSGGWGGPHAPLPSLPSALCRCQGTPQAYQVQDKRNKHKRRMRYVSVDGPESRPNCTPTHRAYTQTSQARATANAMGCTCLGFGVGWRAGLERRPLFVVESTRHAPRQLAAEVKQDRRGLKRKQRVRARTAAAAAFVHSRPLPETRQGTGRAPAALTCGPLAGWLRGRPGS